jgi:Tol biopolymer transport system component
LDTNNNSIKELTAGPDDYSPVCSTNGKWIYFSHRNGIDSPTQILQLSIDGGTAKSLLTKDEFAGFDVSRDGSLLAFLSWDKLEKRPIGLSGVWSPSLKFGLLNMDTGKMERTLTVTPQPGERVVVRFTPDSKALAYISRINGVDNIWAQPLDGAAAYPITAFKSDEISDFHWSPGGDRLGIVRGGTDSNVVLIREPSP